MNTDKVPPQVELSTIKLSILSADTAICSSCGKLCSLHWLNECKLCGSSFCGMEGCPTHPLSECLQQRYRNIISGTPHFGLKAALCALLLLTLLSVSMSTWNHEEIEHKVVAGHSGRSYTAPLSIE